MLFRSELGLEERNRTYARFLNLLKVGSAIVIAILIVLFFIFKG